MKKIKFLILISIFFSIYVLVLFIEGTTTAVDVMGQQDDQTQVLVNQVDNETAAIQAQIANMTADEVANQMEMLEKRNPASLSTFEKTKLNILENKLADNSVCKVYRASSANKIKIHRDNLTIPPGFSKVLDIYPLGLGPTGINDLDRLPCEVAESTGNKNLNIFGRHTSGLRIKFVTDSDVYFNFLVEELFTPNWSKVMTSGIDIYVDGKYRKSYWPQNGVIENILDIRELEKKERIIEIYFPLYAEILSYDIATEIDSSIQLSNPSEVTRPIVYYGSSITQGCCASNPGMSYPAMIYRKNNVPFINLGFSGNGLGEIKIADYINSLNPSLVILDYWANPSSDSYSITLPLFVERIYSNLPEVSIVINSTFFSPGNEKDQAQKDEQSKKVESKYPSRVYFAEKLFNQEDTEGLIDGRHLNSYGFYLIANRLLDFIVKNELL